MSNKRVANVQLGYHSLFFSEMSPVRASLAAESAAELPLMPTWLGTEINHNPLPISGQIHIKFQKSAPKKGGHTSG